MSGRRSMYNVHLLKETEIDFLEIRGEAVQLDFQRDAGVILENFANNLEDSE
jgi:hypothetical protein